MNILEAEPEIIAPKKDLNLILHCGGQEQTFDAVRAVHTPSATRSWQPVAHDYLVGEVRDTLRNNGLAVRQEVHSLAKDGQRYFGLMEVHRKAEKELADTSWVLGLRNSHDQSFSAGMVVGMSVFVCDNLSFSGEIKVLRKHTTNVFKDLPQLVSRSVGELVTRWNSQETRVLAYKEAELDDKTVHDLVVRAADNGTCAYSYVPKVLKAWREPPPEAFLPRNAWSLFNAFTETLKGGNLYELPKRTQALHGLLDMHCGLSVGVN